MSKLKCPHCGNIFESNDNSPQTVCPFCGFTGENVNYHNSEPEAAVEMVPSEIVSPQIDGPLKLVNKLSKSWIMLLLAISVTITTVFCIIDLIPNLRGISFISNLVKLIFNILLCAGVWIIFTSACAKKKNSSGFKCVNAYITLHYVLIMLVAIAIFAFICLAFSLISEIGGDFEVADGITLNTVLIIVLIVAIAVIVVISLFFKSISGALKSARNLMESRPIGKTNFLLGAIILFLIGIVKLIMVCISGMITGVIMSALEAIAGESEALGGVLGKITLSSSWSSILVDVADVLNYLLGGVLLIMFTIKAKPYLPSNNI